MVSKSENLFEGSDSAPGTCTMNSMTIISEPRPITAENQHNPEGSKHGV